MYFTIPFRISKPDFSLIYTKIIFLINFSQVLLFAIYVTLYYNVLGVVFCQFRSAGTLLPETLTAFASCPRLCGRYISLERMIYMEFANKTAIHCNKIGRAHV